MQERDPSGVAVGELLSSRGVQAGDEKKKSQHVYKGGEINSRDHPGQWFSHFIYQNHLEGLLTHILQDPTLQCLIQEL